MLSPATSPIVTQVATQAHAPMALNSVNVCQRIWVMPAMMPLASRSPTMYLATTTTMPPYRDTMASARSR
jgi:hypothetical protein